MLEIVVPAQQLFDEVTSEVSELPAVTLKLEHSLASLSKWESKFEKAFLAPGDKTESDTISYIEAMCLTPDVSPEVFKRLSPDNRHQINEYIQSKQTATWFGELPPGRTSVNREIYTAEVIYYWMVSHQIPIECENWHLNRLLTLIRVCNQKNNPKKSKVPMNDELARRRELNNARRAAAGTNG